MTQPTNQSLPVPKVYSATGGCLIIGMNVQFCYPGEPDLGGLEGELIKVSHNGYFIYVKLNEKLLPGSDHPEILITSPTLWVYKRQA